MSTKYSKSEDVPIEILCKRLDEIVEAVTARDYGKSLINECTMRVPAEVDRDADLVLSEVARRLREYAKESTVQVDVQCTCQRYDSDGSKVFPQRFCAGCRHTA